MATTRITTQLPPNIDVTKAPLAYGDRALPKLNRELKDPELITRQRALRTLCDCLHDPENIAEALKVGVAESLKALLSDQDGTVRHKTTEALYIISGHNIGRDAFIEFSIIFPLSKLFDDELDIVRRNAHMAMEMLTEFYPGAEGVVETHLIPILVDKLKIEVDEIKEYILDTLHFCMRLDQVQALIAGAMEVFTELLLHNSPIIRAKAARDVMDLSVPLDGKRKACECNSLPSLVTLLSDDEPDVRAKAAGAIMTITITTQGKYTAIKAGAIPELVKLVDDESSEVRLNAITAITTLSEAPEGRKELLEDVDRIKKRTEDESAAVVKAAEIAVRVITWKP
ncbi:radial spoke head 14 homolog [Lytechinus variegatus]|uniref:radial spoke head 14 homolog n=1 Tax=Lytechinus variegatus TaxID=7654 RepID=UPI001BB18460|nr:radial spoke head 14 homolog [Lytechinus variegatus]